MELLQVLCQCDFKDIPPFMIRRLMAHGYSEAELLESGVLQESIDNTKPVLDADGNAYSKVVKGD